MPSRFGRAFQGTTRVIVATDCAAMRPKVLGDLVQLAATTAGFAQMRSSTCGAGGLQQRANIRKSSVYGVCTVMEQKTGLRIDTEDPAAMFPELSFGSDVAIQGGSCDPQFVT